MRRTLTISGAAALLLALAGCQALADLTSDGQEIGPETGGTGGDDAADDDPVGWTAFESVALIGDGVTPCSAGLSYATIDACYNQLNPPVPALQREVNELRRGDPGTVLYPPTWGGEGVDASEHGGRTQILPFARQTRDGRLSLNGGCAGCPYRPSFATFRPEAMDYDLAVKPGEAANPRAVGGVAPWMLWNPLATTIATQRPSFDLYEGDPLHHTLCEATPEGDLASQNPHRCTMSKGGVTSLGDCYQVTMLFGASGPTKDATGADMEARPKVFELRSTDLTVFVPDAKSTAAGEGGGAHRTIYPRIENPPIGPGGTWILPPIEDYDPKPSWDEFSHPGRSYASLLTDPADPNWGCYTAAGAPNPTAPRWCQFYYGQRSRAIFDIDDDGDGDLDDGVSRCVGSKSGCKPYALFELHTTGDGRLLVLNLNDKGIFYSYNTGTPCHADGFGRLRPLSAMPVDPVLAGTSYGLVKSAKGQPFRTSTGEALPIGALGNGAYPWIASDGSNLVWAQVNQGRDGYYARRTVGWPAPFDPGPPAVLASAGGYEHEPKRLLNPDVGGAGKGVTVLGAWTQGKMVALDNGLNATDFARSSLAPQVVDSIDLQLYSFEGPRPLRPRGSSTINSLEHKLNHFDALTPALPFDVVWTFSSNNQHDAEVAFDRYMQQNALVVAHMNAPIDTCTFGVEMFRDGFVPEHPGERVRDGEAPEFRFAENPRLQNASTASAAQAGPGEFYVVPPPTLLLRGGARVEPIALGGVLGKGVYLDGDNDFVQFDVPAQPTPLDHAYLSLWIHARDRIANKPTVLYTFADGSWIGVRGVHVAGAFEWRAVAYDAAADLQKEVTIASGAAPRLIELYGWRQIGIALRRSAPIGGLVTRSLDVYLSGTFAATLTFAEPTSTRGFPLQGRMTVGGTPTPPGSARQNLRGWIDELTILAYPAGQLPPPTQASTFRELACNEALGTIVDVAPRPGEAPSAALAALRARFDELPGTPTQVCEQLRLASTTRPLDLAPQRGVGLCVDRFHRNAGPEGDRCVRRALFGIDDRMPFDPDAPRPGFADVPFCQGCHRAGAAVEGLRPAALAPGAATVRRFEDHRRQPLDWPVLMTGVVPAWAGPGPGPLGIVGRWLDFLFDQGPRVEP
jgi:hypothetical protein